MIKIICDVCKSEIKKDDFSDAHPLAEQTMYTIKTFGQFAESPYDGVIFNAQLCPDCQKKMSEEIRLAIQKGIKR